ACLAGILGAMLDEFAKTYQLDERQTRELLISSAAGSLALAERGPATLGELVSSVSNAGGLTEVGVSAIRSNLPPVLGELRDALVRKRGFRWGQSLATN